MTLFISSVVILSLWSACTETTFPSKFLTPFIPSPKVLYKVSSTLSPSTPENSQVTTKIPAQDSNDFIKLHKWLEQTQKSAYHSTSKDEKNHEQQSFHLHEGVQPQVHHLPDIPVIVAHPVEKFSPAEGQVAALATNYDRPQRSAVNHHQHQLVPLTFPPTSTGLADTYSLPKIISLPPLPPSPPQQQQLPQSSSHYTTSSLSYFSEGPKQGYGPPKSTKVVRHVSVFVAPPSLPYSQNRQKIRVQGEPEKHVNIIFIKSPDSGKSSTAEIELPPVPEQKTYVYVLNKAQEGPENVVVNTPEPPKYSPPDVFFINYKNGKNPQSEYGPPPLQQYGTPPQQYGSPSQQQEHGASVKQEQQQSPNSPQQKSQSRPSLEYIAPSNQNFNFTLPMSLSLPPLPPLKSDNQTQKSTTNTYPLESESTQNNIANRRMQEESYRPAHNINYGNLEGKQDQQPQPAVISQQDQNLKKIEEKILRLQLAHGIIKSNIINIKINDTGESKQSKGHAFRPTQDSAPSQVQVSPTSTSFISAASTITSETKPADAVSVSPSIITARSFFPAGTTSSISITSYVPVSEKADGIPLRPIRNASFGESYPNNISNKNESVNSSASDTPDIRLLAKRNLTSVPSTNLVDDNVKKKGSSPSAISGRPRQFGPYEYAPTMGYEYYGIASSQV